MANRRNRAVLFHLDEKTRFALKLISNQRRNTQTAVVSDALEEAAKTVDLGGFVWTDLWDPNPAIRELKCLACPAFKKTDEQNETLAFTVKHREFFYVDRECKTPRETFVEVRVYGLTLFIVRV